MDRRASERRPRRQGRARAGLTLVELLMVLVLVGLLFGAGIGFGASLDLGGRAAVGLVESAIRSARNAAVARRAPARLVVDAAVGAVWAEALEVVGTWHFEGTLGGARGLAGVAAGAEIGEDGWIGRALYFPPGRGATAEFPVQADPSFDFEGGFALECALRAEGGGTGSAVDAGGLFGLELGEGGAVCGWFVPQATGADGRAHAGGRQRLCSARGALAPGRWVEVRFEHDGRRARLALDGVEAARLEREGALWRMQGPLVLGDAARGLALGLDGLVLSAVARGERVELPGDARFGPGAPAAIAFDAAGFLDGERHRSPVELLLELPEDRGGRTARVRVGRYGTVDTELGP